MKTHLLYSAALSCALVLGNTGCDNDLIHLEEFVLSAEPERLTWDHRVKSAPAWSPDGTKIIFSVEDAIARVSGITPSGSNSVSIGVLPVAPDALVDLSTLASGDRYAATSPDRISLLTVVPNSTAPDTVDRGVSFSNPAWSMSGDKLSAYYSDGVSNYLRIYETDNRLARQIKLDDKQHPAAQTWTTEGGLYLATSEGGERSSIYRVAGNRLERIMSVKGKLLALAGGQHIGALIGIVKKSSGRAVIGISIDHQRELSLWQTGNRINQIVWHPTEGILCSDSESIYSIDRTGLAASMRVDKNHILSTGESAILAISKISYNELHLLDLTNRQIRKITHHRAIALNDQAGAFDLYPSWFPDSRKVVFSRLHVDKNGLEKAQFWQIDIESTQSTAIVHPGIELTAAEFENGFNADLASDGARLLFNQKGDVIITDLRDGHTSNLRPQHKDPIAYPSWSPEGTQIAGVNQKSHIMNILSVDGSQLTGVTAALDSTKLNQGEPVIIQPAFAPPNHVLGRRIAYVYAYGIFIHYLDQARSEPFIAGGAYPEWSPDGSKLAYIYNNDLYIIPTFHEFE